MEKIDHHALLSVAFVASALLTALPAAAQDSPHNVSANVALTSEYVFRGITQTSEDPALQGGFDYAHDSGLYAGVWGSSLEFREGGDNASWNSITTAVMPARSTTWATTSA